jgi:hypothetical protein
VLFLSNINRTKWSAKVKCHKCVKLIWNDVNVVDNYAAMHLSRPIFECRRCDFKSRCYDITGIGNDVKSKHWSTDLSLIKDNRKKCRDEVKAMTKQCFDIDMRSGNEKQMAKDNESRSIACRQCSEG